MKELVENSLDAGARRITVELEEGGVRLIRVVDDGEGMSPDDATLAFTRHATSKIRDEADLERIATLGFRGEALPSIAAVAAVELTTRTRTAAIAVRVRAEDGGVVEVREAGAPEGTTVAVRDLFGPVPARRKFLKTVATELGQVVQLIVRLSLAYPAIHFRLLHQGREVALHPPVGTLADRVAAIFGRDRVQGGRMLEHEQLGLGISGFLFSPQLSFSSARCLYTYVNGRAVRDRGLTHAIVEGYASLIPRGRWPGAVVLLDLPCGDVDVNVHPAKHEVRFRLAHVVHDAVMTAIRGALAGAPPSARPAVNGVAEALARYAARREHDPTLAFHGGLAHPGAAARDAGGARDTAADVGAGASIAEPAADTAPRPAGSATAAASAVARMAAPAVGVAETAGSAPARAGGFGGLRFVGQVFRGYIICEGADRLVLIDQHAAHERVAFERLRVEYRAGAIEQQPLLMPAVVELEPGRAEALAAAEGRLAALGFDVERFGEHRVYIRAMPALLGADDPRLVLEDLADGLEEIGSQHSADEAIEGILGRIACHSVVRVGRSLAPAEVDALLAALDTLAYASNCPHGRPVSIEYTRAQVERMFGR